MTERTRPQSILPRVLRRYVVLAAGYVLLIALLPVSNTTLHLYSIDPEGYRILAFASAIPSLLAWLAAFIGYAKLHDYAAMIVDTKEGLAYKKLATGVTWLAWALPIPILVAQVLNGISHSYDGFRPTAIIITNIVSVIFPVVAFALISQAARALTRVNGLTFSITRARSVIGGFILAGLFYCYATLSRFDLSSIGNTNNPYYLPLWLMFFVVILPYLYGWFTGLLAAYEIMDVSQKVKGVLYRQALQLLVAGFVLVVAGSIAEQYLYSASPRIGYLVLSYKLVLVSLFRIITGVGFILVALGAGKLKRIEEI